MSYKNISKLHIYYFEVQSQSYLRNIAMCKVSPSRLFADMLCQTFRDTFKQFIANDKVFSFMNNVNGTLAYWKKLLQEVLPIVKQLGSPTFFLPLSCANLRW